jgi:hypothetical protein
MIPWSTLGDWGQKIALVTGVATPLYAGLDYFQLTPVTQTYVTGQINDIRRDISSSRVDTLETKRAVLGLARNDLIREREGLNGALSLSPSYEHQQTFTRRLEAIGLELSRIDRTVTKLDDTIEDLAHK